MYSTVQRFENTPRYFASKKLNLLVFFNSPDKYFFRFFFLGGGGGGGDNLFCSVYLQNKVRIN